MYSSVVFAFNLLQLGISLWLGVEFTVTSGTVLLHELSSICFQSPLVYPRLIPRTPCYAKVIESWHTLHSPLFMAPQFINVPVTFSLRWHLLGICHSHTSVYFLPPFFLPSHVCTKRFILLTASGFLFSFITVKKVWCTMQ